MRPSFPARIRTSVSAESLARSATFESPPIASLRVASGGQEEHGGNGGPLHRAEQALPKGVRTRRQEVSRLAPE